MNRKIKQIQSHANLLFDASVPVAGSANTRLDAIVVPAARPASELQHVISLAATLAVPLVILCSRQAQLRQVVRRVERTFGAEALVIEVPESYRPPCPTPLTSAHEFHLASAERSSDLSVKRNIGLLLGRLRGWSKILFVDDDIRGFNPRDVARLAGYLDRSPVASMVSREFPDNSVVCHARRTVGFKQDVFVSGATLGVNLQHRGLSFFADIYNEDWFFFARHAAERTLPKVGEVSQLEYFPFADPLRAGREEFGDLLAEGLYAAFESGRRSFDDHLRTALHPSHWREYKEVRLETIENTLTALEQVGKWLSQTEYDNMEESLTTARKWSANISPDLCVSFIESWQEDGQRWQQMLSRLPSRLSERDALAELQLQSWRSCGYGRPTESETNLAPAGAVC
ncbi:hypothetical protein EV649_6236 [Kribbella sp. VKM Ac-2569]|uniref:hypothetical protein n=1 Tax=Kribbella sp. VKM Ac-2569 TaxID=2512220 RepID=UPI00102AD028|nr:hypothetical protein [Kribbella sp. VKM Ac-2569]RZT15447.1 hypothetical protein EV649_6236 [Kribbella sp. VKM Ac-2569]